MTKHRYNGNTYQDKFVQNINKFKRMDTFILIRKLECQLILLLRVQYLGRVLMFDKLLSLYEVWKHRGEEPSEVHRENIEKCYGKLEGVEFYYGAIDLDL